MELVGVTAVWSELALYLGLNDSIKEIELQYHDNPRRCLHELINKWMNKYPKGTWEDIVNALEKTGNKSLANDLHKKYQKSREPARAITSSTSLSRPLFIDDDIVSRVKELKEQYADMLIVIRNVSLTAKALKDLKYYLSDLLDDSGFENCETIAALVGHLKDQNYINEFDIHVLETCHKKEKFECKNVQDSVGNYCSFLKDFNSCATVGQLKNTFLQQTSCPSIDDEELILKLDEVQSKMTLNSLKKLAYQLLGVAMKAAKPFDFRPGCITVLWHVPLNVVPILEEKARALSPSDLYKKGVLRLKIGSVDIYSGMPTNIYCMCRCLP